MFVDASAIVAILTREVEADALADRLDNASGCITSPVAVFEAALAICRKRRASVSEARRDVGELLDLARVRVVAVTPADGDAALEAFVRYGKGQRNPAQLNLADCFAYAMAKNRAMLLLFKGEDFAMTDIADSR
ncbi:MAG TPA: type II toxin-antitoxin system VapC family toxin [Acetobacteraceae bacterium]|jgi:ribonuclease VapC